MEFCYSRKGRENNFPMDKGKYRAGHDWFFFKPRDTPKDYAGRGYSSPAEKIKVSGRNHPDPYPWSRP